ncbi:probable serine/threonine-protein kinase PBL19 [Musa acuminata AAA Group]|uniref:probable serine/threonine-protein kinase PBL19 n=1 Tax=Musa acuminata AAA Group TaxID=214697 RepID=UPI0031CE4E0D
MACFGSFRKKPKGAPERNSSPAVTSATTTASSSSSTSRSDDSAARKHSSISAGSTTSQKSITDLYEERAHKLHLFTFDELRNATNDFSRMNKIGEGGFGSVYKGYIRHPNGRGGRTLVAIKKLNQKGLQGHKQWLAEVQFLGVFEHPSLVKLVGYCAKDGEGGIERLLVYEYMPNKSLEDHLFKRAYPAIPWNLRLQIALGVAEGLAYLHEEQVIYRDFKASNVLLDKEFNPKLSDFGLAREGPTAGRSHVTTAVVGTYGYAAPDYVETGHLTVKSDVWSFGVVLYEILTGRRSLERNRPPNEQKLLDWVRQNPVETWRFSLIMDPRLRSEFSLGAAREIAKLANSCLAKNPKERPSMSEVVECLRRAATDSNRRRTDAVSSTR